MKLLVAHCFVASLLFVSFAVAQIQAQTYTVGFEQSEYFIGPDDSITLTLVLTEEITAGQTARLAAGGDDGLFGFGVGVDFSAVSGTGGGSTFGSLVVDPAFEQDGTTNVGATDVSLEASEDLIANANGEFGVGGQITSANTYKVNLGELTFNAGDVGSSTTLLAIDHVTPNANMFLFADGFQPTINFSSTVISVLFIDTLKGDVNLSGVVDFADIPSFISVLQGGVFGAEADCNCDGAVNFADIPAFIAILQSF